MVRSQNQQIGFRELPPSLGEAPQDRPIVLLGDLKWQRNRFWLPVLKHLVKSDHSVRISRAMNRFEPLLLRVPHAEPRGSIAIYQQIRIFKEVQRESFGPSCGREVNRSVAPFQIANRHISQPKDSFAK